MDASLWGVVAVALVVVVVAVLVVALARRRRRKARRPSVYAAIRARIEEGRANA